MADRAHPHDVAPSDLLSVDVYAARGCLTPGFLSVSSAAGGAGPVTVSTVQLRKQSLREGKGRAPNHRGGPGRLASDILLRSGWPRNAPSCWPPALAWQGGDDLALHQCHSGHIRSWGPRRSRSCAEAPHLLQGKPSQPLPKRNILPSFYRGWKGGIHQQGETLTQGHVAGLNTVGQVLFLFLQN